MSAACGACSYPLALTLQARDVEAKALETPAGALAPHNWMLLHLILCQASCLLQLEGTCSVSSRVSASHTSSSCMATASSLEMRPLPGFSDYFGALFGFHQVINQAKSMGLHCLLRSAGTDAAVPAPKGWSTLALKLTNLKHRKQYNGRILNFLEEVLK